MKINKKIREQHTGQRAVVLWFTGLSGAGKSTIARIIEQKLCVEGYLSYVLDGDELRSGLNRDLGFSIDDRKENARRVSEVARILHDSGIIVLVALISPFKSERNIARNMFPKGEFIEVYVDTPLEVTEYRDVKGLYKKARSGELINFTGVDSPYEPPTSPEFRIHGTNCTPEDAANQVLQGLRTIILLTPEG